MKAGTRTYRTDQYGCVGNSSWIVQRVGTRSGESSDALVTSSVALVTTSFLLLLVRHLLLLVRHLLLVAYCYY